MSIDDKDMAIRADFSKLSAKQRDMIRMYIRTGNKIQSYVDAYFPEGIEDISEPMANIRASCYKAFAKPYIKAIIEQIREQAIKKAKLRYDDIVDSTVDDIVDDLQDLDIITADATWVLRRAMLLADFNIRTFIKMENGVPVYDFSEATPDDWYCIQEYVVDAVNVVSGNGGSIPASRIKFKTVDKLRALEMVGRHVNIQAFRDSLELVGNKDKPIHTITEAMTAQEAAEAYKDTIDGIK